METLDHRGVARLGPKGHAWQHFCRGPLYIATYLI